MLDFVSQFRECLHRAKLLAQKSLSVAQVTIKSHYDKSATKREFQIGDKVLVLLPIPACALSAKCISPYEV